MRVLLHASLAGVLLVGTTGCLALSAKTATSLNMPEPPSRVVTPPSPPVEPPPVVAPPTTSAPAPPAATGATSSPPTTSTAGRPPQNSTPPAATSTTPPPETPVLQNTNIADTQYLEKKVQEQLESAKRDLDRIDWRRLPKPALEQYNMAMQLYRAAEEARRVKNFSLANQHSEKAALMAALLVKSLSLPVSPTSF